MITIVWTIIHLFSMIICLIKSHETYKHRARMTFVTFKLKIVVVVQTLTKPILDRIVPSKENYQG